MSMPTDNNESVKEYDKNKYKDVKIEIKKMQCLKTDIMSAIVGTVGVIAKETES